MHTQWDPKNFAAQGWFNYDKQGRPIWSDEATLLKSPDWWAYRDPNAEWFTPYVKRQANTGRAIEAAISGATRANLFENYNSEWLDFLGTHYSAYRYVEYGLFMALCQAQREAGSDVIAQPIVFQAVEKDRHAQDITLYGMALEKAIDGFSDNTCKQIWLEDPCWQSARKLVERLLAARDWGEINVIINCLIEPLFSSLFNRELVMRHAPLNGDATTTIVAEGAEADRDVRRQTTKAFTDLMCDQNPQNRDVINAWIIEWADDVFAACEGLRPLFDRLPNASLTFDQAYERVLTDFSEIKQDLELTLV
nr:hypothetical protein [Aestuariicella hydrocarbonica]